MASMGLRPAPLWSLAGGMGEFGGGLLLAFGLFSPLGALGVMGAMAMAIALAHWSKGFWGTQGGYEFPLVLFGTSATLGLTGPGAYSLDALLGIALPVWMFWAGVLGVVLVVAYALSLTRQQVAAH
jgi:putative oxidoreductase